MAMCADDVDLDRDRALVVRFQAGDSAAFDELYLTYYARLVRFCERRVYNQDEAEELAQEAFARAWKALPRLGGEQRFYPWLSVIAGRLCVDALRQRTRHQSIPIRAEVAAVGSDELVVEALDRGDVSVALDRISDRYRDALQLREHQGLSHREIAAHYGVSVGAVEVLLFRARRALRKEYLAVSGSDRGLAAALPALVWLRAKASGFRARFEAVASQGLAPIGANVASLAFVVGATAGMVGGMPADASAPPDAPVAIGAERAAPVSPVAPPVGEVVALPQAPPVARHGAELNHDRAEEFNRSAPVGGDAGVVHVGANPYTVVADVTDDVARLVP